MRISGEIQLTFSIKFKNLLISEISVIESTFDNLLNTLSSLYERECAGPDIIPNIMLIECVFM